MILMVMRTVPKHMKHTKGLGNDRRLESDKSLSRFYHNSTEAVSHLQGSWCLSYGLGQLSLLLNLLFNQSTCHMAWAMSTCMLTCLKRKHGICNVKIFALFGNQMWQFHTSIEGKGCHWDEQHVLPHGLTPKHKVWLSDNSPLII
jgi:hypothetical protein